MKNFVSILVAVLCLLFILGCSQKNSGSESSSGGDSATQEDNSLSSDDESVESFAEFSEESYSSETAKLDYCLYKPADKAEHMPLIVYLHGGSGKGSDLSLVYADGFPRYLKDGEISPVAYVIMPQLSADKKGWADVAAQIEELVDFIVDEYSIDTLKISLTGHSMGGTGTWSSALSMPNKFRRVAPLSGSVKTTQANVSVLKNLSIRAYVGSADTIVDLSSSQKIVAELKKFGADAEITVFDGATHFDIPALAYLNTDVVRWLDYSV